MNINDVDIVVSLHEPNLLCVKISDGEESSKYCEDLDIIKLRHNTNEQAIVGGINLILKMAIDQLKS